MFNLDLGNNYSITCNWKNTRYGFKHEATLYHNYNPVGKNKRCYQNRTYERWAYESVIKDTIDKFLTGKEKEDAIAIVKGVI